MTAEELRKSILQMAIQGKLVKQDPNDEPASVLLERIREEKTRLIKEGKIKGKMTDSVIYKGSDNSYYEKVGKTEVCIDDEIPFELPDSWAWVRHNDIIEISGGAQPPKAKFIDSPRPGYIRLYQIRDYGPSPQPIYIPIETATKTTQKGDILLARYGASLGKVFVAEDGAYNVAMAKVIPLFESMLIDRDYLLLFYKSSIYQGTILGHARSAQAGFNKEDLSGMLFPVPPLKEQQRIVKKVASFNPFIEEYARYNDQEKALDSDIGMLLRKSILQYAIQGKLVPQDPSDEPASILLERICSEREKANGGKKSKAKTESYIFKNSDDNSYYENYEKIDDLLPFEIPDSWRWCRLGELIDFSKNKSVSASDIAPDAWILDLEDIEKDSGKILVKKRKKDLTVKSDKHEFNVGNVLYSKLRPYLNKVVIADEKGYCTSEILAFDFGEILAEYAQIYLMSPYFVDYAMSDAYGVKMPRVGSTQGNAAFMPIPPINEQERIVSAVKEAINSIAALA